MDFCQATEERVAEGEDWEIEKLTIYKMVYIIYISWYDIILCIIYNIIWWYLNRENLSKSQHFERLGIFP